MAKTRKVIPRKVKISISVIRRVESHEKLTKSGHQVETGRQKEVKIYTPNF